MEYNPDQHHRKSIRLKGYDYSQAGLYFITICCHERICLFGTIENHEMILNDAGKIADHCWLDIPNHFPHAVLHEHIVMPNHVHGIIELKKININGNTIGGVGAENFLPLPPRNNIKTNEWVGNIPPQRCNEFQKMIPGSIGSIVRGFKIGVTKWFRFNTTVSTVGAANDQPLLIENVQPQNVWQRNYYEHIIRNEQSYLTISEYIHNNSKKSKEDKFVRH